jgi:cyclopropane fatty-acyl-phospholipid synthase-like methyltransferase
MTADPREVARRLQGVYVRQAGFWDRQRSRDLAERPWLDRMLALAGPGPEVLDLGCGAGEPVARYLVSQGARVHGVDFAAPMIEMARARMPGQRWTLGDMRAPDLTGRYNAIVGWDSFFHLTPPEQRALIARLGDLLLPGGALLLTVGPEAGEPIGEVGGEPVYHASLSPDDYAASLGAVGIRVVTFAAEDPGCGGRSVLLAKRP